MPAQKSNGGEVSSLSAERVSLDSLSALTGFPVELLKKELFLQGKLGADGSLTMTDLREAMVSYLNQTLLESKERPSCN